jgi:hypothetical protein
VSRARLALPLVLLLTAVSVGACSDDDDAGSAEELCSVVGDGRSFTALFDQGFDPTDTQRALSQLAAAKVDLDQLRRAAPAEVRDDLDAEIRYLDAVTRILQGEDPDDPAAVVAAINGLAEERSAAQVASLVLGEFQAQHCG